MHFQPPGGHLAQEEPLPPGGRGEEGVKEEGPKNRPTAPPGDSGTFGSGRV